MALEQKLHLKLSQKLIMTPSLQQAIKLLQLSKLELQEVLNQELLENPLLEESAEESKSEEAEADAQEKTQDTEEAKAAEPAKEKEKDSFDEIDYEAYFQDYMDLSYTPQAPAEEIETRPLENVLSRPQSLSDHLLWQLDMTIASAAQKEIARAIIGNLDEAGYLRASLEEIEAMGPYSPEDVERALHLVQELDPSGVGARDLKECLMIQLSFHDMEGTPAETIIREHLELLQARKFREIAHERVDISPTKCFVDTLDD